MITPIVVRPVSIVGTFVVSFCIFVVFALLIPLPPAFKLFFLLLPYAGFVFVDDFLIEPNRLDVVSANEAVGGTLAKLFSTLIRDYNFSKMNIHEGI